MLQKLAFDVILVLRDKQHQRQILCLSASLLRLFTLHCHYNANKRNSQQFKLRLLAFRRIAQNSVVVFMFYDKYVSYCTKAGIAPTTAAEEMGFSRSDATRWGKGSTPRRATLERVASYFSAKLNLQLSYKEFESAPEICSDPAGHVVDDLANSVNIAMYDGSSYGEVPDDIKNLAAAFTLAKKQQDYKNPAVKKIVDICNAHPDAAEDILLFAEALKRRSEKK